MSTTASPGSRHAEGRVLLALLVHARRPVAHREVGPVVVLAPLGVRQLLPPLLRVLPLRLDERPERGAVDHHPVVEIPRVARVHLAGGTLLRVGVGGWWTLVRALGDPLDEVAQLVAVAEHRVVALLRGARGALVGSVAGLAQVVQLPLEPREGRVQVLGEEHEQRLLVPAVDVDPGDEGLLRARQRPVDGPVLVHALVHVLEEPGRQPGAQIALVVDVRAVSLPLVVEHLRGRVAEAVAVVVRVEGAVEEEDAGRERVREVVGGRVEDALAVGAEAAEGDAEGEAEVVVRWLRLVLRLVGLEGLRGIAVNCTLCPVLAPGPGRGSWLSEVGRTLSCLLVSPELAPKNDDDFARRSDWVHGKSIDVSDLEVHSGVQRFHDSAGPGGVQKTEHTGKVLRVHRRSRAADDRWASVYAGGEACSDGGAGNPNVEVEFLVPYLAAM